MDTIKKTIDVELSRIRFVRAPGKLELHVKLDPRIKAALYGTSTPSPDQSTSRWNTPFYSRGPLGGIPDFSSNYNYSSHGVNAVFVDGSIAPNISWIRSEKAYSPDGMIITLDNPMTKEQMKSALKAYEVAIRRIIEMYMFRIDITMSISVKEAIACA